MSKQSGCTPCQLRRPVVLGVDQLAAAAQRCRRRTALPGSRRGSRRASSSVRVKKLPPPMRTPPQPRPRPGADVEAVRTQPRHQLVDLRLRALPDRHHHDHRRDADDHAERGQRAAQPVAAQGEDRGAQDFAGSSCAPPPWLRLLMQLAVAHHEDAVAVVRDVGIVGDQHHGVAVLLQALEQGEDLLAGLANPARRWVRRRAGSAAG